MNRDELTDTDEDVPVFPNIGRVFNDCYRLLKAFDTGGMGRVYKAVDEKSSEVSGKEEYVAIKVLLPQLSTDKRAIKRLQREAILTKTLRHEHIVGVYDFDREREWTYLLMEWLDGQSLDDLLADEIDGLPLETIKQYLHAISEALSYAHDKGVIHRDIKPKNIFLTKQNRIVLIDFGLSQEARQSLSRLSNTANNNSSGTVPYMPPEALIGGHTPHIKDDIYALGATIYELLTGDVPFIEAVCYNRTTATPLPHKPPQLDESQWQVLSSALAFNPDDRPDSVATFVSDFCSSEHKEKQQQKELINILADKQENATNKPEIKEKTQDQISCDDTCVQRIWAWADEFQIPAEVIPRDKNRLWELQALELGREDIIYRNGEWVDNPYEDLPQITTLPPEIGHLSQLREFYVSGNNLSGLPPEIGQLSQLQRLYVNKNRLSSLPPEIGQLRQLQGLYVRQNQLRTLPPEIGQLRQLQNLYVYNNQLSSLPPQIGQLSQLQSLDVSHNGLSSLPPELWQLRQLQWLDVSYNGFSSLPPEIGQLRQLQWLDVSGINLSSLPASITNLTKLKCLVLRENPDLTKRLLDFFGSSLSREQKAFIKKIGTVQC